MSTFQCMPIETAVADAFRERGVDEAGNPLRRVESHGGNGFPCRHCLAFAAEGEMMLLGSYKLPRPLGIYWTPSPIFVHEGRCARFAEVGTVAPIVRLGTLVSVRAYDAADQCIYERGEVCAGPEVDGPLARAMNDPRTAFVNVHTARPGCLLCRVERVDPLA